MRLGKIVVHGKLDELLKRDVQRVSVVLRGGDDGLMAYCREQGHSVNESGGRLRVEIEGRGRVDELLGLALGRGAQIEEVVPRHETLEDLFVREAIAPRDDGAALAGSS